MSSSYGASLILDAHSDEKGGVVELLAHEEGAIIILGHARADGKTEVDTEVQSVALDHGLHDENTELDTKVQLVALVLDHDPHMSIDT